MTRSQDDPAESLEHCKARMRALCIRWYEQFREGMSDDEVNAISKYLVGGAAEVRAQEARERDDGYDSHAIRRAALEWNDVEGVFSDTLGPLPTILAGECATLACSHLSVPPGNFETAWRRFLQAVTMLKSSRRAMRLSEWFVVGRFRDLMTVPLEESRDLAQVGSFRLAHGPHIGCNHERREFGWEQGMELLGRLEAEATEAAMRSAAAKISTMSQTVFRCLAESGHFSERVGPREHSPDQDSLSHFSECLTTVFSSPGKADRIGARLRNALLLLADADQQERPPIRLALSCSALEALLCSKSDGASDQLARRATWLLAPPEGATRVAAVGAVKDLYNERSRVLHGDSDRVARGTEDKTRRLASGVLKAVLEWRRMAKRGDLPDKDRDLFDEIDQAGHGCTRVAAVPDYLARCLPIPEGGRN